jgi:ABC-type polysaccharide/polyol phosphate transport system ATPase subunit
MPSPALVLTGITKRLASKPASHGIAWRLKQIAHVAGFAGEPEPNTGRALVDGVNLALDSGEIAILIGSPGGGKTSLLEIAAGLTRPTSGTVRVEGGSASLIYPKAGWHTSLSGRDNLILRGLALGLQSSEARRRSERIASFAEVEAAIDRPVYEYSDAMLARLAFGAMAFLDARVLLWDDVLERSDPVFRQKCLAMIPTLTRAGKAILMATHDMGKAEEISPRAIWIDDGQVRADGPTHDVIDRYLEPRITVGPLDPPDVYAEGVSRLADIRLLDKQGASASFYSPGDPIRIAIELQLARRIEQPYFLVSIAGAFGPIAAASMFHDGFRPPFIDGRYRIECAFEKLVLAPRQRFTVRFAVYAADATTIVYPKKVIASFVTGGSAAGCGFFHERAEGRILGGPPVLADYSWKLPGGIEKSWTSEAISWEHPAHAVVGGTRR